MRTGNCRGGFAFISSTTPCWRPRETPARRFRGEAVRALRRLGFQVVRQEGSHIRMSKGAVRLTVP
ncbi:MAG: hypothetical protein DMG24_22270, partial [Acidobacteria bacterium]